MILGFKALNLAWIRTFANYIHRAEPLVGNLTYYFNFFIMSFFFNISFELDFFDIMEAHEIFPSKPETKLCLELR